MKKRSVARTARRRRAAAKQSLATRLFPKSERLEDRMLLAVGPQLVGVSPSSGGLLLSGQKLDVAPHELTVRFDENQIIDPNTLDGIVVTRAGGDGTFGDGTDVVVPPGYIGLTDKSNEVVVRFAETLPDDRYRIDIFGSGATPLQNISGDRFADGQDRRVEFELTLGAQVVSVVPQPVERVGNSLVQRDDQIIVYFNDDDLADTAQSAENPAFYQLIATQTTATNTDDIVHLPIAVEYSAALDRAVLTFANDIGSLSGTGVYRLRVGTDEQFPLAPSFVDVVEEPADTFALATDLGTLDTRSVVVAEAISPQEWLVQYPGGEDEPGHRDIPAQKHLFPFVDPDTGEELVGDPTDGITEFAYHFPVVYGADPQGNQLFNIISERQKSRVREVFDQLSDVMGVQFYEAEGEGIGVARGDMRVATPGINVARFGALGTSGLVQVAPGEFRPTVILDSSEEWDDQLGGDFYQVAMREVTRVLGLGVTEDLPGPVVTGANNDYQDGYFPLAPFSSDLLADLEIGESIYPAGTFRDPVFPSPATIVHGQHLYRPDSIDVDLYRFVLSEAGEFTAETLAERADDSSALDSVLSLYREQAGSRELVARNDDYFSEDAFLDLTLEAGVYYVAVSASGNDQFDPANPGTGSGGTTTGAYELLLKFRPVVGNDSAIRDADVTGRTPSGTALDGDADGAPGGVYNYWFQAVASSSDAADPRTIFIDKSFQDVGGTASLGSLARPYNNLAPAVAAARPGDIIRVVGNGGVDGNLSTLGDNRAYEIGTNAFGELDDGRTLNVPRGVTMMIDAGAIFKMSQSSINVGSFSVNIDRSGSALQVLGTPENSVIFTSADDESIGVDSNPLNTTPDPGDWGGIIYKNDVDRSEGRFDYEQAGVFMDYVNHADIRYGGGRVRLNSISQVVDPVHLVDARPTISFNTIMHSADAAISANPDSFETTNFQAPDSLGVDYQGSTQEDRFTPDYRRVGPDIHGNRLLNNTTNGLFVRIDTPAGNELERMTVTGRWDDTDIVHVVSENLIVQSRPGGSVFDDATGLRLARTDGHLVVDPGIVVKLDGARIEAAVGAQITAEGLPHRNIIMTSLLDERFGAGGTFATSGMSDPDDLPAAGDWSGIYAAPGSQLSIDQALLAYGGGLSRVEGTFARFNTIEIHQAHARIVNSTIENSDKGIGGQADLVRAGRGVNEVGAIFVRGAQPVIMNNVIQGSQGENTPAINVGVNSLNHQYVADWGRSRGFIDQFENTNGNQGPLIRDNRIGGNGINGMIVRGGVLQTEGVWDDTSIVHVLMDEVVIPNFHTYGGLRLESSPLASLVVKAVGPDAGITASGRPLDITDRIGGHFQVVGQPGSPVILTSLADDTVGAGLDPSGLPQLDTDGGGRPLPSELPGSFQIDINYGPVARSTPEFVEAIEMAVQIWERLIEDPIVVTIDVEMTEVGDNYAIVSPQLANVPYDTVVGRMVDDASGRAHEQIVNQLPTLTTLQTNALLPDDTQNPFTIAGTISLTTANARALGLGGALISTPASEFDPTENIDGRIDFDLNPLGFDATENPLFWDMNRNDGLLPDRLDLTSAALSTIGQVLGFESSVDEIAMALTDPPGAPVTNRDISLTPLDLFRLEPGTGADDFTNAPRALDPSLYHVFYDGGFYDPLRIFDEAGLTVGDVPLATSERGDGEDANSWKRLFDANGGSERIGAIIHTFAFGEYLSISEVDRQAFDLIGYDIVGGPVGGDWSGLALDQYSHDRNVDVVVEAEPVGTTTGSVLSTSENDHPDTAEFIGQLADREYSGDDNLRLGFSVFGELRSDNDVDVYSFVALAGTEVWFDIDRTSSSLDTVVELISGDADVFARSDDSVAETTTQPISVVGTDLPKARLADDGVFVASLQKSLFNEVDHWSTNPLDAGMRVILPGAHGSPGTYFVRVRSSSEHLDQLDGGLTSGAYELGIRLREIDEVAGSSVQYAEIGYAVEGLRITGLPHSSPLAGEVVEDDTLNTGLASQNHLRECLRPTVAGGINTEDENICAAFSRGFSDAQVVGNLMTTNQGTISIAGKVTPDGLSETGLDGPGDIDWYLFEVRYDNTEPNGGLNPPQAVDVVFDVDYADALARANLSLDIYRAGGGLFGGFGSSGIIDNLAAGPLVYSSLDGSDPDDLPAPFAGADLEDLSRGSVGSLDPFLGPVTLNPGFYLLKVSASVAEPLDFAQYTDLLPPNPFIRMEPIETIKRVVEDHINLPLDESGIGTVDPPILPQILDENSAVPLTLGDLTLVVAGVAAGTSIFTVDPFTGVVEADYGVMFALDGESRQISDIAIRDNTDFDRSQVDEEGNPIGDSQRNQLIHAFSYDVQVPDAETGHYLSFQLEDSTITGTGAGGEIQDSDGLETYMVDPEAEPDEDPPPIIRADENPDGPDGVEYTALVFNPTDLTQGFAVAQRNTTGVENIIYEFDAVTGGIVADTRDEDALQADVPNMPSNAGTNFIELGVLDLRGGDPDTVMLASDASQIADGDVIGIDLGFTSAEFEFNTGPQLLVNVDPSLGLSVRDGESFTLVSRDGGTTVTTTYEFETGAVLNVAAVPNEGDTVTITGKRGVAVTFEFVHDGVAAGGNVAVQVSAGMAEGDVAAALRDAINATGRFAAYARVVGSRLSLFSDAASAPVVTGSAIEVTGAAGVSPGAIAIPVEESFGSADVIAAMEQVVVEGANHLDNTIAFATAESGDFTGIARIVTDQGVSGEVAAGRTPIALPLAATPEEVAVAISEATDFLIGLDVTGAVLQTPGSSITFTAVPSSFTLGGRAPGGRIQGMAYTGGTLYGVSDQGGLFKLTPGANYVPTSIGLTGTRFSALTAVPDGHELAGTLIAADFRGTLYAFDTLGVPAPVFQGGATSIAMSGILGSVLGIDFNFVGENLWHISGRHSSDIGTGDVNGQNFYFGERGSEINSRNYNFVGGTNGSLITDPISLEGFSSSDAPHLYFSYYLNTDGGNGTDGFRVFVTDDDTPDGRGEWVMLASNQEGEFYSSSSIYRPGVLAEPLFDNSWQDIPLFDEDTGLWLPDGLQSPFSPEDGPGDDAVPFDPGILGWERFEPTVINETNVAWRQARIDLSAFAGSDSLRLRFDFSTAASFDYGATGGVELHGVAGEKIDDGATFNVEGLTYEFDTGFTLVPASGPAFSDGDLILIEAGGEVVAYEIDKDGLLLDSSAIAVPVLDDQTSFVVADTLAGVIAGQNVAGLTVNLAGNQINLQGAASVKTSSAFGLVINGDPGVAAGNIAVTINPTMSDVEVAMVIQEALVETLVGGSEAAIPRVQNMLRLIGLNVNDAGPLGYAGSLPGDFRGSYYDPARGRENRETRVNNDPDDEEGGFIRVHEGVAIDNLIIGFQSRGEEVFDLREDYCFVVPGGCDNEDAPVFIPNIFVPDLNNGQGRTSDDPGIVFGEYQIEIRRGTEVSNGFSVDRTLDPRDRLSQAVVLTAPGGGDIVDGRTFTVGDGTDFVTFEFEDRNVLDGVQAGNFPIEYTPAFPAFVMAELIRDAVNTAERQGLFTVLAATSDGASSGVGTTDTRVNLFGNAIVVPEPAPNGIEFVTVDDTGSGNTQRAQGQVIIDANFIHDSERYGIVVDGGIREMPSAFYLISQGNDQYTRSDYKAPLGGARNLLEINNDSLAPGLTITNNVVSYGGEGGISYGGDQEGYSIVAPIAGDPPQNDLQMSEVWQASDLFFGFRVTDHNGLTLDFEFNRQGAGRVDPDAIPVVWAPTPDCDPNCSPRFSFDFRDTTDALLEALESSNLDVTAHRAKDDEIYLAGAMHIVGLLAADPNVEDPWVESIWFDTFAKPVQKAIVPFGRILNNTLVGNGGDLSGNNIYNEDDFDDIGIRVDHNVSPTLLNNVIVNFHRGVSADDTAQGTVLGGQLFQGNEQNGHNINIGDFAVRAGLSEQLFVDFVNGNFYPADNSIVIDSSVDSLEDRPELLSIKASVGIGASPILAPSGDLLGQRRVDDPSVEPPSGIGDDVFKDRGAIDRSDVIGPSAEFITPQDNGSEDLNAALSQIRLETTLLPRFEIRLNDGSEPGFSSGGSGVDPVTVTSASVRLFRDGTQLTDGVDYAFAFDVTNRTVRLTPAAGVWEAGRTYVIQLINQGDDGIRDLAGHFLQANQTDGSNTFTVEFVAPTDFGDAPDPTYPTLLANDGARHNIVSSIFLGSGVSDESDGSPSADAAADDDDGVAFSGVDPGATATVSITASAAGFIDAWVDFNQDGDWLDAGEQIFASRPVVAGANDFSVDIPASAPLGSSFARFRYSTTGGLLPTGAASDGEVEDYLVRVGPDASWQNPVLNLDVNNDGEITGIDALLVINELNRPTVSNPLTGELPSISDPPSVPPGFLDVDGDGFVAPIDALLVINHLNAQSALAAAREVPSAASVPTGRDVDAAFGSDPGDLSDDLLADDILAGVAEELAKRK